MWYWLSSVIRMSSIFSEMFSISIARSLARTTSVLPAAATVRSSSLPPPTVPSAMPLVWSTRATPIAPSISMISLSAVSMSPMGWVLRMRWDGGPPSGGTGVGMRRGAALGSTRRLRAPGVVGQGGHRRAPRRRRRRAGLRGYFRAVLFRFDREDLHEPAYASTRLEMHHGEVRVARRDQGEQ